MGEVPGAPRVHPAGGVRVNLSDLDTLLGDRLLAGAQALHGWTYWLHMKTGALCHFLGHWDRLLHEEEYTW